MIKTVLKLHFSLSSHLNSGIVSVQPYAWLFILLLFSLAHVVGVTQQVTYSNPFSCLVFYLRHVLHI